VLKNGGNAVDAAIATALTLGVVAPQWSGLGGGGFALIHLSRADQTIVVDYREVAPGKATPEMFELSEGGAVRNDLNSIGGLSVAVPGVVRGIAVMVDRYATMRLRSLAVYAQKQASKGSVTSPSLATIMRENRDACQEKFDRFRATGMVFMRNGRPLRAGQTFRIPHLSETLDVVASEGDAAFYSGLVAKQIVDCVGRNGGILTGEDLASYSSLLRKPVLGTYKGLEICGVPPPSSGGLTVIEILNILERLDLANTKHRDAGVIHLIAEAMKLAYGERARVVGDPDYVDVPVKKLISKDHAYELAALIDRKRAAVFRLDHHHAVHGGSGTSHLSVMDGEGNAVAMTESIECYFGSGILVPEVGILMNDEMHDFDPRAGRPNSILPGKRPMSSMSPTIIFKDGEPYLALGGAGGPRIISSVVETIVNLTDFGMSLSDALSTPRFHYERDTLILEEPVQPKTLGRLRKLGHYVETMRAHDLFFGGVHATMFDKGAFIGAADPRRDGSALSF